MYVFTWKCRGNVNIDISRCIEALLKSGFDTILDFSFRSFSGRTTSRADNTAGTKTSIPFKSRRNRSAEFNRILANVSPHSRD